MLALLALPSVLILSLSSVFLLVSRRYLPAALSAFIAAAVNVYTEQIPLTLFRCFPSDAGSGTVIKVLEYNVCARDEYSALHGREFIDYIIRHDADILFLPENLYYRDHTLDSALSVHYPYSVYSQVPVRERPEEMCIYSRYPMSGIRRLPSLRNPLGSDTMVMADVTIGSSDIVLVHAHCSSNSSGLFSGYRSRRDDARVLCDAIDSVCGHDVILAGDLNDVNGSYLLRSLRRQGLRDAWWDCGMGFGFTYVSGLLRFRLDHVMTGGGLRTRSIRVENVPYSDHRPIIAEIVI